MAMGTQPVVWCLLLLLASGAFCQTSNLTNGTNATNATTTIEFTNAFDLQDFLSKTFQQNNIGGGAGGAAQLAASIVERIEQQVATVDGAAGASIAVEGAKVAIPPGAFSGAVTVTITMTAFSAGTSVVVGVARSSKMKFQVEGGQALRPITISFVISFSRRQIESGNALFLNWLNKKTNVWAPICAPSSLDPATNEFSTETPPEVFNDPAFNPTSGCAADLLGPCDGSGGEFSVFEMPDNTCSSDGGGLSDGAVAGIVIGAVASTALIVTGVWWYATKISESGVKDDVVLSSLVLGQEAVKLPPPVFCDPHSVIPPPPPAFVGSVPLTMVPPPFFGGSPPLMGGIG